MYEVVDPSTGELIERFPTATDEQATEAVLRAHAAFLGWRDRPLRERAAALLRAAELFAERREELAAIATREMGKRTEDARGELSVVADIFRYYAESGPTMVADEPLPIRGGRAMLQKRPLGVLIGVMPWNYPYYQAARFVAPNLLLGNTVILKPAPSCPRSAAAMEELLHDAGIPVDAYSVLYATNEQIAELLADARIQGISLTGSERAGAAVAAEAGRNLKKCVLELGGSDPLIVLDAADVGATVATAVSARMSNMGQACNSSKRFIVMSDVYDEFVEELTRRMSRFQPGDPADPATDLAPLASEAAAANLLEQIADAVGKGATLRTGGHRIERPGSYVEPTVLTEVTPDMRAFSEELFGPAVVVYRVESEDEAVERANDSPYGLGSSVFSADPARAARVGERLEAGMVYINSAGGTQADLPFGGIKRSGFGRELGTLGIEEFMNKRVFLLPEAEAENALLK